MLQVSAFILFMEENHSLSCGPFDSWDHPPAYWKQFSLCVSHLNSEVAPENLLEIPHHGELIKQLDDTQSESKFRERNFPIKRSAADK